MLLIKLKSVKTTCAIKTKYNNNRAALFRNIMWKRRIMCHQNKFITTRYFPLSLLLDLKAHFNQYWRKELDRNPFSVKETSIYVSFNIFRPSWSNQTTNTRDGSQKRRHLLRDGSSVCKTVDSTGIPLGTGDWSFQYISRRKRIPAIRGEDKDGIEYNEPINYSN